MKLVKTAQFYLFNNLKLFAVLLMSITRVIRLLWPAAADANLCVVLNKNGLNIKNMDLFIVYEIFLYCENELLRV